MSFIDNARIYRFHEGRIRDHGTGTVRALGWKTAGSQQKRFEVLAKIGPLDNCSVLDIGCGHGDLLAYLSADHPTLRYMGIDQMEAFLDVAVERYRHMENAKFFLGDFSTGVLPNTDYVIASGALSYKNSDPGFVFSMISKLFGCCRLGFGFNLMAKVPEQDILMAYNPEAILAHCDSIATATVLRQGYFEDDFTVFMYR